jgi:hypothetical protein
MRGAECADREEPSVADRNDQWCGEQRSCDRAERVHRSFDTERSAKLVRWNGAGQQRVARGSLATARDPRSRAGHRDEGPRFGECECAVAERGDRVAARRDGFALDPGTIGDHAPDDLRR